LELFSKEEQIDDFQCNYCKKRTTAVLKPMVSHLPDILVLHLKRFNFEQGYLEKIEDLVTFPLRNLDMSRFMVQGGVRANSTSYDLYAVVNHHVFMNGGGHYTAAVQIKTSDDPMWVLTNDSLVSQVSNP